MQDQGPLQNGIECPRNKNETEEEKDDLTSPFATGIEPEQEPPEKPDKSITDTESDAPGSTTILTTTTWDKYNLQDLLSSQSRVTVT